MENFDALAELVSNEDFREFVAVLDPGDGMLVQGLEGVFLAYADPVFGFAQQLFYHTYAVHNDSKVLSGLLFDFLQNFGNRFQNSIDVLSLKKVEKPSCITLDNRLISVAHQPRSLQILKNQINENLLHQHRR